MIPHVAIWALTLLMVWRSSAAQDQLDCNRCVLIAKALEVAVIQVTAERPAGEHELAGNVRQRRRMTHPRSEPQIFAALDTVCSQFVKEAPESQSWMGEPCSSLMAKHRDKLENDIYANGVENVRRVLCTELTSLCVPHDIVDHGEL